MPRYAAIDIGTVTCRLLVADYDANGLVELDRECEIVNLGIGVDETGYLREDAMDRVVTCISRYLSIIDDLTPEGHAPIVPIIVATSASRDAANSDVFAARLADLGVSLSVIPGKREAALSFLGASRNHIGRSIIVADIGGGSTEIVAGTGGSEPVISHSFDIGCRRATERYLLSDPPLQEEIDRTRTWIEEQLEPFFARLFKEVPTVDALVAVAGTATTTVSVDRKMEHYDPDLVDGVVVSNSTLHGVYETLASVPLEQRQAIVGLEPQRAPVIVAGMIILETVLEASGLPSFTVSESDILQGMIIDAARSEPA